MAAQIAASASVQEGLQREQGRGTLKERRETGWSRNCDSRLRLTGPSPIDGEGEIRAGKRMKASYYEPADIRRVHDDKRNQAGNRQANN